MFSFISTLWFIRTFRAVLFWLYLWQLKEYHIGRFLDHFRTAKGRNIFMNLFFGLKIALIFIYFFLPLLVFFLMIIIYLFELTKTGLDVFLRKIKKPVLTKKTALLICLLLSFELIIIFELIFRIDSIVAFSFWLLVFDVLTPLIISAVILFFRLPLLFKRRDFYGI